jgi:hypothetical protein
MACNFCRENQLSIGFRSFVPLKAPNFGEFVGFCGLARCLQSTYEI